jgi:hypothetical protein
MKNTARLTGPLAAVLGAIAVITAPIANADSADDAFLHTLTQKGITWPNLSDQTMVDVGHAVCQDWSNGFTFDQTLADAKKGLGLDDKTSAQIIGAATGVYCPQYQSKFD